ncbi:DNA N-6-adenine-methyltransferase [Rhodococcoides fascians]|uniref:DNA N-6-adenine-methyltransferase n=1 Tax=Rhodococcoides fascians TaxID=1828 RepID=UPI00068A5501|nr:DNA N-6-adenine-methyltransferase [Rhodococcus fascians]
MGTHHSAQAKSDIWLTPRHILDELGPFDLDPCSAPDPAVWPTASRHITLPTDGLVERWSGRVWLNPPYGQQTWKWLDRLAHHGDGIALIFARTETAGFANQVWGRADAVLFLIGRLTFHNPDGSRGSGNAGAPSCLVAYGLNNAAALKRCGLAGVYVPSWDMSRGSELDIFVSEMESAS